MMRPWFRHEDRQRALASEAGRWIGTPFFHRAASLGHGVDCVNLLHEILVGVQAIPRLQLPSYKLDHAKHTTRTQLLVFLLTAPELAGRLVMVPAHAERVPGDLIGLQAGHTDHHLAMQIHGDVVVHAVEDHGVVYSEANNHKIAARTLYVLRLMETEA